MFRIYLFASLGVVLAACAQSPDKIKAMPAETGTYSGLSCQALTASIASNDQRLAELSIKQKDAQASDAAGVFWIGVPVASVSGKNHDKEIAELKGKQAALHEAKSASRCP